MLKIQVLQANKDMVQITDGTKNMTVPRSVLDSKLADGSIELVALKVRCVEKKRNKHGIITGYIISDANGKTMNVTPKQLKDTIRDYKVSCVNLKLTVDNKLIDLEPEIAKSVEKKEVKEPLKEVKEPLKEVKEEERKPENSTQLSDEEIARQIISRLKVHKEYKDSFVSKIAETFEEKGRISTKQLYCLRKQHDSWYNTKMVEEAKELDEKADNHNYYKESMKAANILKKQTNKAWESSFAYKIYRTISKYKKATYKQYKIIEDELKKHGLDFNSYDDNGDLISNTTENTVTETNVPKDEVMVPEKSAEVVTKESTNEPEVHSDEKETPVDDETTARIRRDFASLIDIEDEAKRITGRQYYKSMTNLGVIAEDDIIYEKMANGQLFVVGLKKGVSKTELIIPDTVNIDGEITPVSGIRSKAFSCTHIRSVVTGENIVDIGQEAFFGCNNLVSADLSRSKHTFISTRLFAECGQLRKISVGRRILRIHEFAFYACTRLGEIEIPNDIEIAKHAFSSNLSLKAVMGSPRSIMENAFLDCVNLKSFDLSHTLSIGTASFRNCGFDEVIIPGNVTFVGNKAFADCISLGNVVIEEGVEKLGEFCFAKSERSILEKKMWRKILGADNVKDAIVPIEIDTPKSIVTTARDPFRHAKLVKVFAGSECESTCVSYQTAYVLKDNVDSTNSVRSRIKAKILGKNPCEVLYDVMEKSEGDVGCYSPFDMKQEKLVNIPLGNNNLNLMGIEVCSEDKATEPNVMFKAAVSYLQDISELFKLPLSNAVLRLQETFYKDSYVIYSDEYNRIIKCTYSLIDTLEEGSFIVALKGNNLIYCADCNQLTDIEVGIGERIKLPIKNYLHAGDRLGNSSSIAGANTVITIDNSKDINVGEQLLKHIMLNGIKVTRTRNEYAVYVPSEDVVIKLYDGREYVTVGGVKKLDTDSPDGLNVTSIMTYKEFLEELKSKTKKDKENVNFFNKLSKLTDAEVKDKIVQMGIIAEEKEAQLYQVSLAIIAQANRLGIVGQGLQSISPSILTPQTFMELSKSYWLIEKDENWLGTAGRKSLNKTHEYNIGVYSIYEYKSNQVVKFSNAYMSGAKGAYVFELKAKGNIIGLYASRFSLAEIVKMAIQLTIVDKRNMQVASNYDKDVPVLLQDAETFDKVSPNLFAKFYDVIYCKEGWALRKFGGTGETRGATFSISMYKPTGIMYLVATLFTEVKDINEETNKKEVVQVKNVTIPIFPIGEMDRALIVANTTNSNNRESKVLDELMSLALYITCNGNKELFNRAIRRYKNFMPDVPERYVAARELIINGVSDVKRYKGLLDDRVIYMIGTVHKGVLQRQGQEYLTDFSVDGEETFDIEDDDFYDEELEQLANGTKLSNNNSNIDYDELIDGIEEDEDTEDEYFDIYDDEEE